MNLPCAAVLIIWPCIGLTVADSDSCVDDSKPVGLRLRSKIFCNYNTAVRPALFHSNFTDVVMHMRLKSLLFEENANTLQIHSWMVFQWRDEYLKWNKSQYDDLDTLQVSSSEIWVPTLMLYNSAYMGNDVSKITWARCNLTSAGAVHCVSPSTYSVYCKADITRWPFDSQRCTALLGAWPNVNGRVNLSVRHEGEVSTVEYSANRDWELKLASVILKKQEFQNYSLPYGVYNFYLKRHSGGRAATVFFPALVLAMLTLCTFWLAPQSIERLFLNSLDILSHCIRLQYLDAILPSNGVKYPIILTFYRDSLRLAGASLVITLVVRKMVVASSEPPSWISTVVNGVLSSHVGQIFLLSGVDPKIVATRDSDDACDAEVVGSSNVSKRWQLIAILFDRTSFLFYLLSFVILLSAYIF